MLKNKLVQKISVLSTLIVITTAASSQLQAGTIVQCGNTICTSDFTVTFNGNATGGGQFLYNAASGDISLNTNANSIVGNGIVQNGGLVWMMGDGSKITVSSLYGNADPILGFSVGASTLRAAQRLVLISIYQWLLRFNRSKLKRLLLTYLNHKCRCTDSGYR